MNECMMTTQSGSECENSISKSNNSPSEDVNFFSAISLAAHTKYRKSIYSNNSLCNINYDRILKNNLVTININYTSNTNITQSVRYYRT